MRNSLFKSLLVLLQFFGLLFCSAHAAENTIEPNNQHRMENMNQKKNPKIIMQLKYGPVEIELYPNEAPKHVERILMLAKEGFYNGLKFHRVIDGFMVQTGDPKGDGTDGSNQPNLPAEFNAINHTRGIVSMARSIDPNSANSQFFIMLGDAKYLDYQYTAFGKVTKGMEFIDMIKKGDTKQNGKVENPDIIRKHHYRARLINLTPLVYLSA